MVHAAANMFWLENYSKYTLNMAQHKELLSNIYCENVPGYTLYPKD